MKDMAPVIVAKSDQLNSIDLSGGPITIKIRDVEIRKGQEQPVWIFYEGDNGKPYKSCKSMSRVITELWDFDANQYVGRSLRLYRDPNVVFGGEKVGGIRISHASHIDGERTIVLAVSKGKFKPYIVRPLVHTASNPSTPSSGPEKASTVDAKWHAWAGKVALAIVDCKTDDELRLVEARIEGQLPGYKEWNADKWADLMQSISTTRSSLLNAQL